MTVVALAASALTAAAVVVPASAATSSSKSKPAKAKKIKVTSNCSSNVATVIPAGQQAITPPLNSGQNYGSIRCSAGGAGVMSQTFTQDDAGDLTGKYTVYFATGTLHGAYTLAQGPGQPSGTTTFFSATYTGTSTVTGGTGTYKKVAGTGTWNCSTLDGVHLICSIKVKVTLPPVTKA